MVTIRIGDSERTMRDATEGWITEQVRRQRTNGNVVCVQVTVKTDDLDLVAATVNCPRIGGSRQPRPHEARIFELWHDRGMDDPKFGPGNLIAFLKHLERLI